MSSGATAGARVLVIEDLPDAAELLTEVLRTAGFDAQAWSRPEGVTDVLLTERVAVLVVAFSGRGIAATTDLVGAVRTRPEEPLAQAGIVALVDDEVDTRFGLAHAADRVLVRPVTAARLVDVVTEVAATHQDSRGYRRSDRDRRAESDRRATTSRQMPRRTSSDRRILRSDVTLAQSSG